MKSVFKTLVRALKRAPQPSSKERQPNPHELVNSALIKDSEGLRLEAYADVGGIWTIGWGHTPAHEGQVITEEEAQALFDRDTGQFVAAINRYVTVDLSQDEFDALVSFVYNIGVGAFMNSTLLRKLNSGAYLDASTEFVRWNKVDGKPVRGLTNRRKVERDLFIGEV